MLLKIKDLTIETTVGIYAEEKQRKQALVVNAEIEFDEGNTAENHRGRNQW